MINHPPPCIARYPMGRQGIGMGDALSGMQSLDWKNKETVVIEVTSPRLPAKLNVYKLPHFRAA
jgi:hypothetical protein